MVRAEKRERGDPLQFVQASFPTQKTYTGVQLLVVLFVLVVLRTSCTTAVAGHLRKVVLATAG